MLVAAKTARSLAADIISQWWDNGQHTEIAVTYLAIPDDGTYTVNQWAQIVRDNLQTGAKLDGVVPVFGSHLTATCQVDDTCKFSDTSGNVAGYAETYDSHFCPIWVRDYKPKTEDAVKNADSYTQFLNLWVLHFSSSVHLANPPSSAIYMKNHFGFLPPPLVQRRWQRRTGA
jgi:hypothetical protein